MGKPKKKCSNCTAAEHAAASALAEETARALGRGWSALVHENLGWHSSATAAGGRVKVDVHRHGSGNVWYTASISRHWVRAADTPRGAVFLALADAEAEVARRTALVAAVRHVVDAAGVPRKGVKS